MSTELRSQATPSDNSSATASVASPQTVPLEKVIEQVRRDSRSDAGRYLEETVAKFGGE